MIKLKKKAFTLVELLFVVLIIAILASIVIPRISGAAGEAKDAKDIANWANLVRALEMHSVRNDVTYPANQTAFDAAILNSATHFPHGAPICPYGNSYIYVSTAGQETVTKHTSGN
jgi:prepilin-type N-terminal cleavage/methylation domain-containing protein